MDFFFKYFPRMYYDDHLIVLFFYFYVLSCINRFSFLHEINSKFDQGILLLF